MRFICNLSVLTCLLSTVAGCGKKEPAVTGRQGGDSASARAKNESGPLTLEGTYLITGIDFNGKKMPESELAKESEADRTVVIKGNKFIAKMMPSGNEEEFKTDATKTPAQIDFTASAPVGKGRTQLGIYKIEGDVLTISVTNAPQQPPKERPKDFDSSKESFILNLKRK